MDERQLREELVRIEAKFAGVPTAGEGVSAEARRRIQARLEGIKQETAAEEYKFTVADTWARKVFVALLRRYGLKPYRYRGQRRTTVMVQVPEPFVRETLWPLYEQVSQTMWAYLAEVTGRVMAEVLHADSAEAPEVSAPT